MNVSFVYFSLCIVFILVTLCVCRRGAAELACSKVALLQHKTFGRVFVFTMNLMKKNPKRLRQDNIVYFKHVNLLKILYASNLVGVTYMYKFLKIKAQGQGHVTSAFMWFF